jgi:hypothetical protein
MPFYPSMSGLSVEATLRGGRPLTGLEAVLFFGYADLAPKARKMKAKGCNVQIRDVPLKVVADRIEAELGAPLPLSWFARARSMGRLVEGGEELDKMAVLTEYFVDVDADDAEARAKVFAAFAADCAKLNLDPAMVVGALAGSKPLADAVVAAAEAAEAKAKAKAEAGARDAEVIAKVNRAYRKTNGKRLKKARAKRTKTEEAV